MLLRNLNTVSYGEKGVLYAIAVKGVCVVCMCNKIKNNKPLLRRRRRHWIPGTWAAIGRTDPQFR